MCLPACVSEPYVHAQYPWRPEEDVVSLGLELHMVLSHQMGAGKIHGSSRRIANGLSSKSSL